MSTLFFGSEGVDVITRGELDAALEDLDLGFSVINAQVDHGAEGDGSTDDTLALNEFFAACANGAALGYLPAGGSMAGTQFDTLTLKRYGGTHWYEVARAVL